MDKSSAIKAAVAQLMAAISEADGKELVSRRKPKAVSVEVEAMGEEGKCAECEAGTCVEHLGEEDMAALES